MDKKTIFSRYLIFLGIFLLASGFYLPIHYNFTYPAPLAFQFEPDIKKEHLRIVEKKRPDLVLIGDSVLELGVNADMFSERTGLKSYSIYVPGSGTAAWYLLMKNVILATEHHPKYIAIVFRNTMLTVPQYRTTGKYEELLDDYASDNEPLLLELAFIDQMKPPEKFFQKYFPLYSARRKVREDLEDFLRYTLPSVLGCNKRCVDGAIKSTFGMEVDLAVSTQVLEDASKTLYNPEEMNFEKQVADSFLPFMIELAHEKNVTLIFVKTGVVGAEPAALDDYSKSLASYISKQKNVYLIDFRHDPRIKKEFYYMDGLHFNEYGRVEFTKLLAGEITKVIEDKK
jgi:hypothetical protein